MDFVLFSILQDEKSGRVSLQDIVEATLRPCGTFAVNVGKTYCVRRDPSVGIEALGLVLKPERTVPAQGK